MPVLFLPALPAALPALVALALAAGAARADVVSEARMAPPTLSPAELQSCVSQRERMAQAGDELAQLQSALERDRAEIERLSDALDLRLGTLDRHDGGAVSAFHAEMQERDLRILAHVDRLPAFHARTEVLKAEEAAWTAQCAGRPVPDPQQGEAAIPLGD